MACLLGAAVALPASAAVEGKDYIVMPVAVAPLQKDKIEVVEFFAYWCPHCADLEPLLHQHAKTFASDTVLRTEHIVWDSDRDMNLAKLSAAVNAANVSKAKVDHAIFEAMVRSGMKLNQEAVLKTWLLEQKSFNGARIWAMYRTFGVQAAANNMAAWTREYGITSTPTVIVGGKYQVLQNGSYEHFFKTVDELVQKVREERRMAKPAAKAAVGAAKSTGVGLVKKAMQ